MVSEAPAGDGWWVTPGLHSPQLETTLGNISQSLRVFKPELICHLDSWLLGMKKKPAFLAIPCMESAGLL